MSISDRLDASTSSPKMEGTDPLWGIVDGKVSFRRSRQFHLNVPMMKVAFPFRTLTWCLNSFVSRQGNGFYNRIESTKRHIVPLHLTGN